MSEIGRCMKCDAPLIEGANFCSACAEPVEGSERSREVARAPSRKERSGSRTRILVAAGLVILTAIAFLARTPDETPEVAPPTEEGTATGGQERFSGGVEAVISNIPPAEPGVKVTEAKPGPPPKPAPAEAVPPPESCSSGWPMCRCGPKESVWATR